MTALCDQFQCGLLDVKCQRELPYKADLTEDLALKKVRAPEVVLKETEGTQAYYWRATLLYRLLVQARPPNQFAF